MVSLLAFLSITIPIFCTFFFFLFANGAVQSLCTFFFHRHIVLWSGQTIAWGMAATLGGTSAFPILTTGVSLRRIGQSALASNRFVEAGMVLGHGVSSLTWKVVALGTASGFCLLGVHCSWGQKGILPLGAFLWGKGFLQISLVPNYIQSLEWIWLLISPWAYWWLM